MRVVTHAHPDHTGSAINDSPGLFVREPPVAHQVDPAAGHGRRGMSAAQVIDLPQPFRSLRGPFLEGALRIR